MSHFPEDKGETTLFKICLMCTPSMYFWRTLGCTSVWETSSWILWLGHGSLTVYAFASIVLPTLLSYVIKRGWFSWSKKTLAGARLWERETRGVWSGSHGQQGWQCPEPVRGPGNPQHKAALIPTDVQNDLQVCRGVGQCLRNRRKNRNPQKEYVSASWGQILCSWFGGKMQQL